MLEEPGKDSVDEEKVKSKRAGKKSNKNREEKSPLLFVKFFSVRFDFFGSSTLSAPGSPRMSVDSATEVLE